MTEDRDDVRDAGAEGLGLLRAEVVRVMRGFGADYWREVDRARVFPEAFFVEMGERGYFGTLLPERWGGSDAGPMAASVLIEAVNRAGGDASTLNAQMAICGALLRSGSAAQQERYLPGIARGDVRCLCVAATEPDSGADMRSLRSRARRDGDDWVLDAHKVFISLAEHTDLLLLLVATDEGPTLFALDMEECGDRVERRPVDMVVNRLTTALFIDSLRVPDGARIGRVGGGLECLIGGFAQRRIFAASESLGNARCLLDLSVAHAKERVTFDRPIGSNQGVQYPLAQAYARIEAADLMRSDALRLLVAGEDAGARSALAKLLASEAGWEMARAALTTFGGWGLASELAVERKIRETMVFVFNNMLWSYLAERELGLPKAF